MKPLLTFPVKAILAFALLTCVATAAQAAPPADEITLTGWLHVEDLTMEDVTLEVEVHGTTQVVPVSERGRFTVQLPADSEALLHFEKPGHLSKEVIVDTRNSDVGVGAQRARHLRCAVIMELERHMGRLVYGGPVGSIAFDPGGGCVAVAHTRNMVMPAARNKPMVF